MKSLISIAFLLHALGAREYGLYSLVRQVGGLIYDFSGNNFHGRNGNNILEDSNDGVFTDRGLYLDGTSSYFLVHSDEFGQGPVFAEEWSFSMWIFTMANGPVIHRTSDQGNTSFKLVLTISGVYVELNDCSASCSLKDFNLSLTYPFNTWFLLSMEIIDGDNIQFYENATSMATHTTGMKYGDSDSYSFTYIGTDSSSFLNAFVYHIRINSSNAQPLALVAINNNLCDGLCYFNTSPHSSCSCTNCSRVYSRQCLSHCDNYNLASDCSTDTSSCQGIYVIGLGCIECPQDKWPVCKVLSSEDLSATLCHSSCRGCKGRTSSDCLGCSVLYMNLNSGTCECPSNSTLVGSECVCNSSYYMSSTGSSHSCVPCSWPCLECSGASTFCTSCVQTSANLDSSLGECSCPANSSSTASSCDCDPGYSLRVVENTFDCSNCLFPCLDCSGTADSCTSCLSSFNLKGNSCVCPNNSTVVSNKCECDSGFVSYFDLEFECIECSSPCLECSEVSTSCTACLPSFNLSGSSCVCPAQSSLESNQCVCASGFLLSAVSNNEFECFECTYPCSECSMSPSNCTECLYASSIVLNGSCVCPENSSLLSEECSCDEGYKMEDSECVKKEEVVLNSYDSVESIVISSVTTSVFVSSVLLSDPSSVWMILNNIQFLSYLPLHAFDLPEQLKTTCNAFKLSSILPNISIILFGDDLRTHGLPQAWKENGIERTHFFLNIGQVLLVLFLYLCYLLIVAGAICINKEKYGKYLQEFRYNVVLRLWVEIYIEVLFASLISWNLVLEGRFEFENIVGAVVFLIQIASIFSIWKKLHSITKNSQRTPEDIRNRFSCLLYEFDDEKSVDGFMFYIYFLIRRVVYLLGLFYLSSLPILQLTLSLSCSFVQILVLAFQVKFHDKLNQKISICIEILLGVIFILILYFNSKISHAERELIEYLSIGVVGLMVTLILINHIAKVFLKCWGMRKNKQNVIIDESAIGDKNNNEDSMVFSLSQNKRRHDAQISLNVENLY